MVIVKEVIHVKQKLDISQIIRILEEQKELEKDYINNRKNNISKSYDMAKHDFRCIENMEDVYETLDYIIDKLEDCQDRIIERNKINLRDL